MAFQSMLNGAECSTSSNPLAQLLKHSNHDTSLQQDRTQSEPSLRQGQGQAGNGFRQSQAPPPNASPAEVDAFFRQQAQFNNPAQANNFSMEAMRREMESLRSANANGNGNGNDWSQEMNMNMNMNMRAPNGMTLHEMEAAFNRGQMNMNLNQQNHGSAWGDQFARGGGGGSSSAQSASRPAASTMNGMGMMGGMGNTGMRSMGMGMGMGMGSMNMGGMSARLSNVSNSAQQETSNKLVQLDDKDWEEQFKALDKQDQESGSTQDKGKGKAKETDASDISKEEAEQEAEVRRALDDLEKDIKYDGQSANSRFEALWESMQANSATGSNPNTDAELAKWEEELMKQSGGGVGYSHPGGGIGGEISGLEETAGWDGTEDRLMDGFGSVSDDGFPRLGSYRFNEQNPFLNHPDPLGEGLRMLSSNGGSLADAAMLFEAATRSEVGENALRGPAGTGGEQDEVDRNRRERSEAWRRLGEAQAMNERETQAIRALEESVRVDEGNGSAMLELAISYTNEGFDRAAHSTLERYIKAMYPHLYKPSPPQDSSNPWSSLSHVTDLFLAAAREGQARNQIDPDVQVGLGVLFYSNSAYDEAKDCFQTALDARPNDVMLWNRLGATLANGGKPEEAIEAYQRALELRPTFTRAIYNLSVSCLNLGAHHEAAEHLLAALALQQTQTNMIPDAPEGENGFQTKTTPLAVQQESHNLWSTLRRIFLCMDRMDLAQKAHVGSDVSQFKKEGFEF